MNAIVKISGKQYSVEKDTKLFVDKLQEKEGSKITFDNVLMVDNGSNTKIGNPVVAGASAVVTRAPVGTRVRFGDGTGDAMCDGL